MPNRVVTTRASYLKNLKGYVLNLHRKYVLLGFFFLDFCLVFLTVLCASKLIGSVLLVKSRALLFFISLTIV